MQELWNLTDRGVKFVNIEHEGYVNSREDVHVTGEKANYQKKCTQVTGKSGVGNCNKVVTENCTIPLRAVDPVEP